MDKNLNILAIGAHFDDVELGCSGTLMKHIDDGDNVILLVVTNSNYSDPNGKEIRSKNIAKAEGEEAAKIMGVKLIQLSNETFFVENNELLTSEIIKIIEKNEIDCIYSHWPHDIHRDHQNVAQSSLMAGRKVKKFLFYRSNYYDSYENFVGNFYSDISLYMENKINVIKAHKSEIERVRGEWIEFFLNQNSNDGKKIGVKYAEAFQVVRYLI